METTRNESYSRRRSAPACGVSECDSYRVPCRRMARGDMARSARLPHQNFRASARSWSSVMCCSLTTIVPAIRRARSGWFFFSSATRWSIALLGPVELPRTRIFSAPASVRDGVVEALQFRLALAVGVVSHVVQISV